MEKLFIVTLKNESGDITNHEVHSYTEANAMSKAELEIGGGYKAICTHPPRPDYPWEKGRG